MKKIYVLTKCNFEDYSIIGVYEDLKEAEEQKIRLLELQKDVVAHKQYSITITECVLN